MSMTPKEHLLVLTLFVKQAQIAKVMLDILKSRGLLTDDDARAFEFSANVDAASISALFEQSKAKYLALARGLGIETGLEKSSPTSASDFSATNP